MAEGLQSRRRRCEMERVDDGWGRDVGTDGGPNAKKGVIMEDIETCCLLIRTNHVRKLEGGFRE
jgi:hypothetical protein